MLMSLLPLAGFAATGDLNGTTQYTDLGFKYKILSIYKTPDATHKNTVSVSQNVYATNGAATIVIPATVTIYVKGTDDASANYAIDQAVTFDVVEIEENAFKDVTTGKDGVKVTGIQIGKNVATIGDHAFEGCSNVTSITFDANTNTFDGTAGNTIPAGVFKGTKVEKLDLTPLTNLNKVNAWFGTGTYAAGTTLNETLTEVKFPAKLKSIEANAFAGCTALKTVVFPETGLTAADGYLDIKAGAFQETAIVNLDLTEAKIETLNKLFETDNVTLKTVKMAKSVVTLETNALADCIVLNSVDFSKSTKLTKLKGGSLSNTVVKEYDFSKCYTLTPGNNPTYATKLDFTTGQNPFVSGTITKNKNLTKVILPFDADLKYSPVTNLFTVFANCEKLATIEHLEVSKITTVDDKAFENDVTLASLSFPASLQTVSGAPFVGCKALKVLTFDGTATGGLAIGDGTHNIYGLVSATPVAKSPLEELYITAPTAANGTKTSANATIKANALADGTTVLSSLKKVEIAVDGIFAGTIEAGGFALAANEDAEVKFGDIAGATFAGKIVGPKGLKKATLTIGEWHITNPATQAIIDGVISVATVGEVKEGSVLTAIGQAEKINFTGDITTAALVIAKPTVPNDVLNEVEFNAVKLAEGSFAAGAFGNDGTTNNAPILTTVTWNPVDDDAKKAFNQATFGNTPVGAAATVTLKTTNAVANLYQRLEANLYNVIFEADGEIETPTTATIPVYGTATATYFYGKFTAPTATAPATDVNVAIDKKGGDVMVYSAFVDSDNNIYMDPLALNNGRYIIEHGQTVIIRVKASALAEEDITEMTKPAGGLEAKVGYANVDPATYPSTMRYNKSGKVVNDLNVSEKVYSSDYIATTYGESKTLYAMKNPASVGKLDWGKVATSSYLPKGAVFVVCNESAEARLNIIWLDDNTTAIEDILNKENAQNGAMYTLQGVRISAPVKGQIYIQNGKKYLAK